MSEDVGDSLHNLVTQVSAIRLKLELVLNKHPELTELPDIVALTDDVQREIARSVSLWQHESEALRLGKSK